MGIMLLLLISLLGLVPAPASAATWVARMHGSVRVFVHPGEEALAGEIGTMARGDLPRITTALGVARPATIDIYAYRRADEFHAETQNSPYTVGVSYSPSGIIRLDASREAYSLRRTLAHELTHSLLSQRLGIALNDLPVWVNEGIAGLLSDPLSRDDMRKVALMTHRDGVFSLDALDRAFATHAHNDVAYVQTRAMVSWLEAQYPRAMRTILARIADDGESFPAALYAVTGLTEEQWLRRWINSVPDYLFWILLLNSPIVYAPAAIILVILVTLRLRKQRMADLDAAGNVPPPPSPKNDRHPDEMRDLPCD